MSLREKSSLYDRHSRGVLGPSVERESGEGPNPSNGAYFADEGNNFSTPFGPATSTAGGGTLEEFDHLKELLQNNIFSSNTATTYYASPKEGTQFQDLHPGATDFFSGQPTNSTLGQFGGPYTTVSTACVEDGGLC